MAQDEDYEVGYGRPPKKHQFSGGKSPNPGGRPKKQPSLGEILEKVLHKHMKVKVDGKDTKMAAIEVALTTQMTKAAKGDTAAMKVIASLLPLLPRAANDVQDPELSAYLVALVAQIAKEEGQ